MLLKCVQLLLSCLMILGTFSFAFAYYEYEKTGTSRVGETEPSLCDFTQSCDEVLTEEPEEEMLAKRDVYEGQ